MTMVLSCCASAISIGVEPGTYGALVPSAEQLDADVAGVLPGGFDQLRTGDIDAIEIVITDTSVVVTLDGMNAVNRRIEESLQITDAEGSGPFKASKEVLVLGAEALSLGPLTIEAPVVWPGGFEGSPTITVKSFAPSDRGPISCDNSEACLVAWSGSQPQGSYVAATPDGVVNPIASISVDGISVRLLLTSGTQLAAPVPRRDEDRYAFACGLSRNRLWDVPVEAGLPMDEPVLAHTTCPTNPGDPWLMIMDRTDIPVLAPLDGLWCDPTDPTGTCLLFVPVPANEVAP